MPSSPSSPRRVRFSPKARVFVVPPLSQIDPSVLSACHYSDSDFESMQRDTVKTIRAMRYKKGPLNETKMTARGLESLQSQETVEAKKKNRDDAVNAVLDEQDRQWNCGRDDDERIASASRAVSETAVRQALHLGKSDAAFVRSSLRMEARARTAARAASRSALEKAQEVLAGQPRRVSPGEAHKTRCSSERHLTVPVNDAPPSSPRHCSRMVHDQERRRSN